MANKWTPTKLKTEVAEMKKQIMKKRDDPKTKFRVVSMFNYINQLVNYRIPTPPIDVSDDGKHFTCPTCKTKFETEDTIDDFAVCYICGQVWKQVTCD